MDDMAYSIKAKKIKFIKKTYIIVCIHQKLKNIRK